MDNRRSCVCKLEIKTIVSSLQQTLTGQNDLQFFRRIGEITADQRYTPMRNALLADQRAQDYISVSCQLLVPQEGLLRLMVVVITQSTLLPTSSESPKYHDKELEPLGHTLQHSIFKCPECQVCCFILC